MYNLYLRYKDIDNNYLYLFKCGNFYIFIDEDCDVISKFTTLKKIKLTKDVYKCGFPVNSLDTYLNIFNEIGLNVKVVEDESYNNELLIKRLDNIDINNITGIDAINILKELKDLV